LRIGYLSSFFGARNWMKMFMGVINAHDRDRFEVHLIATGDLPSAETGYRDHPDDRIWEVGDISNAELAGHISEARLDVLIDLNGYSDLARMPVLLYRAAPTQISWANMYATTGFPTVDCVVGDRWTIPPEEEQFCVERVRRVPLTYLAFDVFYPVPDVAPPPWAGTGHVTFGSLMSAYKITDQVIASWSKILRSVPGSRLLLRNRALSDASNRADFLARFAANGIDAVRLTLEGGGEHLDFLRSYDRIDIALDAFPYNGGTSTAEALWQGVPLLSFNGDRWASRTSRSILMAAGLGCWGAEDQQGFEAMATRLGLAPEPLAASRAGQRAQVAASAACDTAGLCRALEAIYQAEVATGASNTFHRSP
jgi:protein O-GlcNAc transferase